MRQRSRNEIIELLRGNREAIRGYGVEQLGIFGSRAREEGTSASDLDVLVKLKAASFDSYMELKFFLEDLLDCPVDLVMEHTLKPRLRPQIMKDLVDVTGL